MSFSGIINNLLEFSGILAELARAPCTRQFSDEVIQPAGIFRPVLLRDKMTPAWPCFHHLVRFPFVRRGWAGIARSPEQKGTQQIYSYLHLNEQNVNPSGGIEYKENAVGCASVLPYTIPVKDFLAKIYAVDKTGQADGQDAPPATG